MLSICMAMSMFIAIVAGGWTVFIGMENLSIDLCFEFPIDGEEWELVPEDDEE